MSTVCFRCVAISWLFLYSPPVFIFYLWAKPQAQAFHQPYSHKTPPGYAVRRYCLFPPHTVHPSYLSPPWGPLSCWKVLWKQWSSFLGLSACAWHNTSGKESLRCFAAQHNAQAMLHQGQKFAGGFFNSHLYSMGGNCFQRSPDHPSHPVFSSLLLCLMQAQKPPARPASMGK